MKIWKFISSIITCALSIIGLIFCNNIASDIGSKQGLETISFIVTYPTFIIANVIVFGLLLSTFITSLKSISSTTTLIKVFAIIILIISVLLFAFQGYTLNKIFHFIS